MLSLQSIVVVIPTYNEALVIEQTIREVFKALTACDYSAQILVFDSCSTDNTQAIVRRLQADYPTLHLQTEPQKTGLGSAYLQAMRYALDELAADVVIEFDADLSHQPIYLPELIKQVQRYDVALGSRYVRGGSIPANWGWHRKLLSVLGNWVARALLTPKYKDFTSGFRATRRSMLQKVLPKQFISKHYAYKLELLWRLHRAKARIVEYPIEFVDREQGHSKLPANSIIDSLRVLAILRYRELKSYFSMCAVGLLGFVVQALIYNLLRLKCEPFLAAQIAVSAAIINNFILNNQFTFKARLSTNYLRSAAFFITYSLLMIELQSHWVRLAVDYFGLGYLTENLIIASAVLFGSVLNYLFYSRIVWRKKEPVIN